MKLYKREGRRFVACEPIDNTGKYYQSDGTFSDCKTEASIGLCILSSVTEDVVMYLRDGEFKSGVIPTSAIMLKALLEFRHELDLHFDANYECIDPITSATLAAYARDDGTASHNAATYAYFIHTRTRQIIKVRKC